MKKSQQVRELIARAKAQGVDADAIISEVMNDLGFKRQLARAYINNNWNRVEAEHTQATAERALSMTPGAIRKREARAAARAQKLAAHA